MTTEKSPAGGQSAGQMPSHVRASRHHDHSGADYSGTLFDPGLEAARRDRDDGAQLALDAAHSWSRSAAEAAIRRLAASGEDFTSDDVHELVGGPLACSANTMGALILAAARAGTIVKVGYRQSTRRSGRGRVVAVWAQAEGGGGAA